MSVSGYLPVAWLVIGAVSLVGLFCWLVAMDRHLFRIAQNIERHVLRTAREAAKPPPSPSSTPRLAFDVDREGRVSSIYSHKDSIDLSGLSDAERAAIGRVLLDPNQRVKPAVAT